MNRLITNASIYWNPVDLSTHGRTKTIMTCDLELIGNVKLDLERQNFAYMSRGMIQTVALS